MEGILKRYLPWLITGGIVIYTTLDKVCVNNSLWDNAEYTGTIITFLAILYCKWGWRINPFESTPKLSKNYAGELISDYDNNSRDVQIEIKQTLYSTQVFLITGESRSRAIASKIYTEYGETFLTYSYLNIPAATVRNRSAIHYGMCTLQIINDEELVGQYFTDRKTTGDIKLKKENSRGETNGN